MRRLRVMSVGEIGARVGDAVRYARVFVGGAPVPRRVDAAQSCVASFDLSSVSPDARQRVIERARSWLAHRGSIFELSDVDLGEPIDWRRDYASGVGSPGGFSALINHRDAERVGDVRYIWQLNRLQHLVELALACVWTGEAAYAEEIVRQLRSWEDANPFLDGVNWKSPLEAGLRLITWSYVFVLGRQVEPLQEFFRERMGAALYQHQRFVADFPSRHSSANNHLVGEMAGLYLASVVMPWFPESEAWRDKAYAALHGAIEAQVFPDGVGREQAIDYQLFTMELFLACATLASRVGRPFSQAFWQRWQAMARFVATVRDRAGHVPRWGDGDDSTVLALPDSPAERVDGLVGRVGEGGIGTVTDLRMHLLTWGSKDLLPKPRVDDEECTAFTSGGYAVLACDRGSDDEVVLAMDAGPLGLEPLAAHGHADALSLWMSVGGREMLVDPGTFSYFRDPHWRGYFRGTRAHNTVLVDGLDQSEAGGRFLWTRAAACTMEPPRREDGVDCLSGWHDGYCRLADPVIHRRMVRLDRKSAAITVRDRLECEGRHQVEVLFHFAADCRVTASASHRFEVSNGARTIVVRLDPATDPVLYAGSADPLAGWESPAFGSKVESVTLVARMEIHGSTEVVSELAIDRGVGL